MVGTNEHFGGLHCLYLQTTKKRMREGGRDDNGGLHYSLPDFTPIKTASISARRRIAIAIACSLLRSEDSYRIGGTRALKGKRKSGLRSGGFSSMPHSHKEKYATL